MKKTIALYRRALISEIVLNYPSSAFRTAKEWGLIVRGGWPDGWHDAPSTATVKRQLWRLVDDGKMYFNNWSRGYYHRHEFKRADLT